MSNDREIIDSIPEAGWRAMEKCRAKSDFVFALLFASCSALLIAMVTGLVEAMVAVCLFALGVFWLMRTVRSLRKAYTRGPKKYLEKKRTDKFSVSNE
jgi:hypothetical protein